MRITRVAATWLHLPILAERQAFLRRYAMQ
jgi:hypothetical protein